MSRESKRLKKSSGDWLNSGNALIQHLSKNAIFVFSRFARSIRYSKPNVGRFLRHGASKGQGLQPHTCIEEGLHICNSYYLI